MFHYISHHIYPCATSLKSTLGPPNQVEGEIENIEQEEGGQIDYQDMGAADHSGGREAEGGGDVEIVEELRASTLALAQRRRTVAFMNYIQMSHELCHTPLPPRVSVRTQDPPQRGEKRYQKTAAVCFQLPFCRLDLDRGPLQEGIMAKNDMLIIVDLYCHRIEVGFILY